MAIPLPRRDKIHELSVIILIVLLVSISEKTELELYKTAFYNKFSKKFHAYIKNAAWKSYNHSPDWSEVAEEIFQDSFLDLFQAINNRNFRLPEECSEKEAFNKTLGWLCRTGNNKLMSYINAQKKERTGFSEYQEYVEQGHDDGEIFKRAVIKSYDIEKMAVILKDMTPLERQLIILCYDHSCFPTIEEKNTKQLPRKIIKDVCAEHDVTPVNLRKIKQIAFKKIIGCRLPKDTNQET